MAVRPLTGLLLTTMELKLINRHFQLLTVGRVDTQTAPQGTYNVQRNVSPS